MTVEEKDGEEFSAADFAETASLTPHEMTLLIVDDDRPFLNRLSAAMQARGFLVSVADSVKTGLAAISQNPPAFAIIDMRLGDGNGLDVISELKARRPDARGVMLTGYANIATAVTAVKLGAFDYLAKPADADEIYHALMATQSEKPETSESTMSADRVRWEHIQRVFEACDRNVSETARRLNMHRRTLQRILAKRAPR
jgi:two-component system, response regulator RegA